MGDDQTVCVPATQCSSTQYQVAAATSTSDAICVANTVCGAGTLSQGSTTPTTCAATCTPCSANQAMVGVADGCPNCITLQTGGVNQASITAQGTTVNIQATSVTTQGADLVQWALTLQNQLQSTQAAAIAQQAANEQNRIRLESQVAMQNGKIAVLQGTLSAIVARLNGQ